MRFHLDVEMIKPFSDNPSCIYWFIIVLEAGIEIEL
jgi:hypothetical protein